MAPAAKNSTPGRRKQRTDDQYFELGKRGRKTGIELRDTGLRDENGLEPISGIFSSPNEPHGDKTLTSEEMDLQNSSAPDVRRTLSRRKTPRLPPPRQSTPRHTNIGSPKRGSSVRPATRREEETEEEYGSGAHTQPPANRRLDFGGQTNRNRKSIHTVDTRSPFKPTKTLRRSTGPGRPDPYAIPEEEDDEGQIARTSIEYTNGVLDDDEEEVEDLVEQSIEEDGPIYMDDGDSYPLDNEQTMGDLEAIEAPPTSDSPLKRKRGRPRKSDQSVDSSQIQSFSSKSNKRPRASLDADRSIAGSSAQDALDAPSRKKRSSGADKVIVHRDSGTEIIDASGIAYGDQYMVVEDDADDGPAEQLSQQLDSQLVVEEPELGKKGKGRAKGKKGKAAAPRERDANRSMQSGGSVARDSPSKRQRGTSIGPVSNVNLRAVTPFEDAGRSQSRFGRNLIQPLKYWENESRIWREGEIEGIVRAEHVEKPKPRTKRRKKGGRRGTRLDSIDEESETESVMPDEWEEELGVISGTVANWDPEAKAGDPEDAIQEDLGFASSSIITRDVAGSDFKYAKIMTIPFFGAGLVELPPEGYKRAKNSRVMQMVFFVHEGKVSVEVGAQGMEVNQFTLTKGGCWVVPRGNNYSVTNCSSTRDAKVFFAQGCEVR